MEIKCKYCGLTPPKNHWNGQKWIEKHEANCPQKPGHNGNS